MHQLVVCWAIIAIAYTAALPSEQLVLSNLQPPSEDEGEGWIDPRINGGQFLDVRTPSPLLYTLVS